MKPKPVIIGAAGRMGRRIISLTIDAGDFDIIAAVERKGRPDIGKDALGQKGTTWYALSARRRYYRYTLGEMVVLNYTAHGTLQAAKRLIGKEPDLYSTADVLASQL